MLDQTVRLGDQTGSARHGTAEIGRGDGIGSAAKTSGRRRATTNPDSLSMVVESTKVSRRTCSPVA